MASRDREGRVRRLRISFQQLQRKCSELLLEGFESQPAENDLEDVASSSSCTEYDGRRNNHGVGLERRDSPKKGAGGGGGLFQIKPTAPQSAADGSRSDAGRRRGFEQPERWQRDKRFTREEEAGRFSEPTAGADSTRSRCSTDRFYNAWDRHKANTEWSEHAQQMTEPTFERERTRQRRHTDDGGRGAFDRRKGDERRIGDASLESRRESSLGQRLSSATADKDLADWRRYTDGRIQTALLKLTDHPSKLTQILHTCSRLQETGRSLLLNNLELSMKQEVTSKMWKLAHYPIIEVLRDQASESEESAQRDQLDSFLINSITFYQSLIASVEDKYGFQLSEVLAGRTQFQSKSHRRSVMMAISVCEYCYIYLGDLVRYHEQYICDKPDWSKPRAYYLKAQSLAPKDGKPYNQLAVVALNAHRRLDACYYYMRSLKAKVPFQSAMDRLVGLFEDASRKAKRVEEEEKKMKNKADREAARKKKRSERLKNRKLKETKNPFIHQFSSGKKEVWIMPGTEMAGRKSDQNKGDVPDRTREAAVDEYYTTFTHSEVLKKLVSAFLVTHGKLFTKIGIELFDGSRDRLLQLWHSYWMRQGELTTGDTTRLLKMTVVNVFSLHNADEMHTDEGSSRHYIGMAFSLALQLNTTLLDACSQLIDLLPQPCPVNLLPQCSASNVEERSSNDQPMSDSAHPPPELVDHTTQLSHQEASDDIIKSGKDATSNTSETPKEMSVFPRDSATSQTPLSYQLDLSSAAPKLLCALDMLAIVLPSVRVWLEWMKLHDKLWTRSVSQNTQNSAMLYKFWRSSFTFINKALDLFPRSSEHIHSIDERRVHLWEDRMMAGFMPLKENLSVQDTFAIKEFSKLSVDELREQCVARVLDMAVLCRELCDTVNSIPDCGFAIEFDSKFSLVERANISATLSPTGAPSSASAEGASSNGVADETNGHHSVPKANSVDDKEDGRGDEETVSSEGEDMEGYESDTSCSSSGEDVLVVDSEEEEEEKGAELGEELPEDDEESGSVVDNNIQQLKAQREALAKELEQHKRVVETAESVLSEAASRKEHEIHITPKYLIPDTNCYVDRLPSIKALVDTTHFTVAVPLIVLAELEGLSKGSLEPSLKQNATKTTAGAKAAVEFINSSFSRKNAHVKALTTQGSLMASISFRAEVTGKASNDDLILESCLNLHSKIDKIKANQTDAAECYSVVLLTDDRNLRVKALANNLPVKDLQDFMKLLQHQ